MFRKLLFIVIFAIILLVLIPWSVVFYGRNDLLYGFTATAILAMISSGVWLTFYMGRINIGQGAYALLGAYISAILIKDYGLSFWISIFFAGLGASLFSVMIGFPMLRLRGVYFAMITLTLTEVMRLITIAFSFVTHGPRGITSIPLPGSVNIFGVQLIPAFSTLENTKIAFYYLSVILMIICFCVMYRIVNSRMGALLRSLQQNEELASSLGVDIAILRVKAYALGSFFGGLGGAIFVSITQSVYPTTFQVADSINYMLYTFLGGLGYVFGPILGSLILYFSWDLLYVLGDYQLLLYSGMMILLMLFLPNGILSLSLPKFLKFRGKNGK